MDLNALGVVVGILAVIGGLIRWLLGYWMKNQKELTDLKASYTASAIATLNSAIDEHRKLLGVHTARLQSLETTLKTLTNRIEDARMSINDVAVSLKEFSKKTETKQEQLASDQLQITKDLILLKGKVDGRGAK